MSGGGGGGGEPVSAIRNLGPASEAGFARAGMHSAEEVRALGADEAYKRLVRAGTRPHFIGYYALVMGLQGRPWNDLDREEKAALRVRFDALVAEARGAAPGGGAAPGAELARALDLFGVVDRPAPARPKK